MEVKQNSFFLTASYREAGVTHLENYHDCEDAVCTGICQKPHLAVSVLCDGAGSCQYAEKGAEITADTVREVLTERFEALYHMPEEEFAEYLLRCVRNRLADEAEMLRCETKELSATLLCAVLASDGRYLYFHIGDGIIAAADCQGRSRLVSSYQHEIAPNYTVFVTTENAKYYYGKGQGDISAFLLMSDGPEPSLSYGGFLTSRAKLLVYMSYFFKEDRLEAELQALTGYLKKHGMYDDASYALLADRRFAGEVFQNIPDNWINLLFGMSEKKSKSQKKKIADLLEVLALEDSVSENEAADILHQHRDKNRTYRKLLCLMESGVLIYQDGRYYFR